jgi:hypothetical protein
MARNLVKVRPEVLSAVVEFVRCNPSIPSDAEHLGAVLRAYDKTIPKPLLAPEVSPCKCAVPSCVLHPDHGDTHDDGNGNQWTYTALAPEVSPG